MLDLRGTVRAVQTFQRQDDRVFGMRVFVFMSMCMLVFMVMIAAMLVFVLMLMIAAMLVFVLMFMFMLVRDDLDLRLMPVHDLLDHAVQLLRHGMSGVNGQRLLREVHRRRGDMLHCSNVPLDLFRAVRAVQPFQRIHQLHDTLPILKMILNFIFASVEQIFN